MHRNDIEKLVLHLIGQFPDRDHRQPLNRVHGGEPGTRRMRTAIGDMLDNGCWFQWSLGSQLPDLVKIHRGGVHNCVVVATISRQQALALIRWHYTPGVYYSYLTLSGQWHDVRVCGDIQAWYGEEWLLIQKHKKELEHENE
jgi:hypothetical protein